MSEPGDAPVAAWQRHAETVLGAALTLVALGWALEVPQRIGWSLFSEQFLGAILALTLPLTFLVTSRGRRRGAASWYDVALAAIGFLAAAYVAWRYPELQNQLVYRPIEGVVIGAVLIVLVIEGVRRTCGVALMIIIQSAAGLVFVESAKVERRGLSCIAVAPDAQG